MVVVAVIRVDKLLELVYSFVSDHIGYSKFLTMYIRDVWRGNEQPSPLKDLRILLAPRPHSFTHPDFWTFVLSISIVLLVCLMYLISIC